MRTTILSSPVGHSQFDGIPLVYVRSDDHYRRCEKTAPCGCVWRGLVGVRGCGYSDGQISLCPTHAIPEDDE